MHTGKKQERKKTIRKSVSSCITLQSAQSAEIRTLFLAYSRDLRRLLGEERQDDAKRILFKQVGGEVCVCVCAMNMFLLIKSIKDE